MAQAEGAMIRPSTAFSQDIDIRTYEILCRLVDVRLSEIDPLAAARPSNALIAPLVIIQRTLGVKMLPDRARV